MEYNSLIILVMMLLVFRLNGNIKTLVFGNIMDSRIYFFCLTETVNTGPAKTSSDHLLKTMRPCNIRIYPFRGLITESLFFWLRLPHQYSA